MQIIQNLTQKQKLLLAAGIFIVVMLLIILLLGRLFPSNDGVGTGPEYSSPDGPALLSNSKELYEQLNDGRQFSAVALDLGVYGRAVIDDYSKEAVNVLFEVNPKSIKTEGSTISFDGRFDKKKHDADVRVEQLENGRIKVSITGEDSSNVDDQLPSNSKRNQFIASLPISTPSYSIDYNITSDTISVSLYNEDPATRQEVEQLLTDNGVDLTKEKVNFIIPSWVTGGMN